MKNAIALVLSSIALALLAFLGFQYLGEWMFAIILTGTIVGLIFSRNPRFGRRS